MLFVQRYVLHTRKSQMTHSSSHFSLSKNQFFWFCLRSWLVLGWVKEKVLLWWVRRSTISRYICTFYIVIRACIWFYTHTFKATLCNVCRHMCAEKTCCFQSVGAHSDFLESNIQWTDITAFSHFIKSMCHIKETSVYPPRYIYLHLKSSAWWSRVSFGSCDCYWP